MNIISYSTYIGLRFVADQRHDTRLPPQSEERKNSEQRHERS